jgi:hypothetical protein
MSVVLNSEEFVPTQREDIRKEIDKILDDFMEPLMVQTIVTEIKSIAMAANIPQGFIDGVKFRRTEPNKGEIINTWGTSEKPLAIWFNYGTVQHWIEPVNKKALAFPAASGKHATAIYFQGEKTPEGTKFSTGHYVSGVPRTEAMEIGFNVGKKRLAAEASKIVERELRYE